VTNWFYGTQLRIETVEFADQTVWNAADIAARLNAVPVLALAPVDQFAIETRAFSYTLPAETFADADAGDLLTLSATLANGASLPDWLIFSQSTGVLEGTPPDSAAGVLDIQINAIDRSGAVATAGFKLDIANIVNGTSRSEILTGTAGRDAMYGLGGNDRLDGGGGADLLIGGSGNDTYTVDNAADTIVEMASEGTDLVQASVSYTLADNIENLTLTGTTTINGTGNALANVMTGNSSANILTGGAGNDTLDGGAGADTLIGGAGNDIYVVDDVADSVVELAAEGTDTVRSGVSYALAANVENLTLTGTAAIDGIGNLLANVLTGNGAANTLIAGDGNDTLNGAGGPDILIGGLGNDTYDVDDAGDVVVELLGEGTDTVRSTISFTLAENVERLTLMGAAAINGFGNKLDNRITGNAGANTLSGDAGNDTLNGGAGADTMIGGLGNDIFVVDNDGDIVIEAAAEGTDTVLSSISMVLAANVENLILTGSAAIDGTGNALANTITGNTAANRLAGGAGDDIYIVNNVEDTVVELAAEGIDLVKASVTYSLADNVENITLAGTAAIDATGNMLANVLVGNSASNMLTGGGGNDILDGAGGADSMLGGQGDDVYKVDNAADLVTELAGEGIDSVIASVTFSLSANVENLTLSGSSAINATGNMSANVLTGNSGANTLIGGAGDDTLNGGAGADTLIGGTGDDLYMVDNLGDIVTELDAEGTDSVNSAITYTLGANLENLTLVNKSSIAGGGNELNNVLTGNSGNNTLTGYAGDDVLDGKAGNDTLVGGTGNDRYLLSRGYGSDRILENDATPGNTDAAWFDAGIAADQLWFRHVSNNLEVSVIGTGDKFSLANWYLGNQYHVEQFKTSDGRTLLDSQVQNLVSAMAAFAPPSAGTLDLSAAYASQLAPVIAANWQ
jgi:Ca2+-binding RTX toxin-like protein